MMLRDLLKNTGLNVISDKEIDEGLSNVPRDLQKRPLKAVAI
jgi:hypothetical protein